jgi:aspartate/methionine/tyrosine aminotransferase
LPLARIRIVSDEIYHGLTYGVGQRCVLPHGPDALVIGSFSKYFNMVCWRLGWLLVPCSLVERARAYATNLYLTAPSLSQHAAEAVFDCFDVLEDHVAVYRRNRAFLLDALPRLGLPAFAPPDGAFYIWADVSHITTDSLAWCKSLLDRTGVALAPGRDFDPVKGDRFVRLSFSVSSAEVEEAIERLGPGVRAR